MQPVSDDVWKRVLEKPRFEQVVKGIFRLGRCYIFTQCIPGLWASNQESTATDSWSLDRWHQKTIRAFRMKWPSAGKTTYWHNYDLIKNPQYKICAFCARRNSTVTCRRCTLTVSQHKPQIWIWIPTTPNWPFLVQSLHIFRGLAFVQLYPSW